MATFPDATTESHVQWLLALTTLALLVVGGGIWYWRSTTAPANYSELFWLASPSFDGTAIRFSTQLNSFESSEVRVDLNAYLNSTLVSRKKIQIVPGQSMQVDFNLVADRLPPEDVEVRVVAQRYDVLGSPLKTPLEIRDWLRAKKN